MFFVALAGISLSGEVNRVMTWLITRGVVVLRLLGSGLRIRSQIDVSCSANNESYLEPDGRSRTHAPIRVFHFFDVETPQQMAEALLMAQRATSRPDGGRATVLLEKRKMWRGSVGSSGAKGAKLLDILTSSPLRNIGDSEDDGSGSRPPAAAQPIMAIALEERWAPLLEYNEMEPESDGEVARKVESAIAATEPQAAAVPATHSWTTSSSSTSSSLSSDEGNGNNHGTEYMGQIATSGAATAVGSKDEGLKPPEPRPAKPRPAVSTLTESSSYHVSSSDPIEAAATLGASNTKLIEGNVVGSLQFSSCDQERKFLAEAGGSFSFTLIEKRLMATGVSQML